MCTSAAVRATLRASDSSRSRPSTSSMRRASASRCSRTACRADSVCGTSSASAIASTSSMRDERGRVHAVAAHRAQHVEHAHVLAPLPDRVALRVPQQARDSPVLAVAVAAEELHRRARGLHPEPAQPCLRRGHEDPPQQIAIAPARRERALEPERDRRFQLALHVDELFAHEREVDEQPAPNAPVVRPDRRLEEAPARDAEPHHRDTEAGAVHHLHHAVRPARSEPDPSPCCARSAYPIAPWNSTSAVGTLLVPSLSLSRRIVKWLRLPSSRCPGTR